jgi:outer membrane protein assembly factor BamB
MNTSALLLRRGLAALAAVAAASLFPAHADAVGTRTFQLTSLEDFKGGDLTGVSVDANGNVHAGLNLGSIAIPDAATVHSSAVLGDGTVLLGTNEGKVFRVSGGQVALAATTGQMAVSSMAVAWDGDVIAGSFPEGKIYKIPAGQKGGAAAVFATLPAGVEDVWALAFDPKAQALYAATGPEGKLFRLDKTGKAQVYFDSKEPHLKSVAVGGDGTVYAGSHGKALLYKITGPGRATVLYDFDADDVWAIAVAPLEKGGAVYAVANKYNEAFVSPKRNKAGPPTPQPTKSARPGKGYLMRITTNGATEMMMEDDESHFTSLTLGDDGQPYVGTGAEGRLYTVDDNHLERLVADTEERQVGAVVMAGKRKFLASSDPVVFHEVKGVGGADAVWTSKVLDAGLRATYGRLKWRSTGAIELSTRSGNTVVPDATWSAWSAPLAAPGEVKSPAARFAQIRARFSRDPHASLREVTLYFVTDNARTLVTSIDASARSHGRTLHTGVHASGGEPSRPSSTVKVSWKVENPDQDEMRYRLSYRLDGETTWRPMQKPSDKLTRTDYEWDTSALPEGTYRIMVEASDELANPPDRVQKHSLISHAVLVDNTPPVFKSLALNGRRLTAEVVDGVGPIARLEVSVAGTDEWRPLFPKDGVFDQPAESFDADISALVPTGSHLVAVRAYDSAGNMVSRNAEAR